MRNTGDDERTASEPRWFVNGKKGVSGYLRGHFERRVASAYTAGYQSNIVGMWSGGRGCRSLPQGECSGRKIPYAGMSPKQGCSTTKTMLLRWPQQKWPDL